MQRKLDKITKISANQRNMDINFKGGSKSALDNYDIIEESNTPLLKEVDESQYKLKLDCLKKSLKGKVQGLVDTSRHETLISTRRSLYKSNLQTT